MHTWLIQEQLSQRAYKDEWGTKLFYYRTHKGRILHLVIENEKTVSAVKLLSEEKFSEKDLEILKAFRVKNKNSLLFLLGAQQLSFPKEKIEVYPWESIG